MRGFCRDEGTTSIRPNSLSRWLVKDFPLLLAGLGTGLSLRKLENRSWISTFHPAQVQPPPALLDLWI